MVIYTITKWQKHESVITNASDKIPIASRKQLNEKYKFLINTISYSNELLIVIIVDDDLIPDIIDIA